MLIKGENTGQRFTKGVVFEVLEMSLIVSASDVGSRFVVEVLGSRKGLFKALAFVVFCLRVSQILQADNVPLWPPA